MRSRFLLWLSLLVGVAPISAVADDLPFEPGHLELVSGLVAYRLGSDPWSPAERNYPVFEGMELSTDPQGRAEIGLGPNALRMANDTEVEVTSLGERITDVMVHQGTINLAMRKVDPGAGVELELSFGTLWVLDPGHYIIDTGDGKSEARVRVLDGKARLVSAKADQDIGAGDEAVITADNRISLTVPSPPPAADQQKSAGGVLQPGGGAVQAQANNAPAAVPDAAATKSPDEFIQWSMARDTAAVRPNTPAQTPGGDIAQLDAYGQWRDASGYGEVWFPTAVPADWAPYRFGHWASIPPWGWTWIDDQPWAFIPSHYGRWVNVAGQWGWIPGNAAEPARYAPALVSFIGDPNGIAVDPGADPAVGWVPLGPGEAFWPWYAAGAAYVAGVNSADVRDFRGASPARVDALRHDAERGNLANRQFATVVDRGTFVRAAPIGPAMMHVAPDRLAHAPAMMGAPRLAAVRPVAPMREAAAAAHAMPAPGARPGGPGAGGRPGGQAMAGAPGRAEQGRAEPGRAAMPQAHAMSQAHAMPATARTMAPQRSYQPQRSFQTPMASRSMMARPQMQMGRPQMQMGRPQMQMARPQMQMARPQMQMARPQMQMARPQMRAPAPRAAAPAGRHR
jgi:hypothetical protein